MRRPKDILITGTSHGLGRDLVAHYIERGCRVFGCSRSKSAIVSDRYHHIQGDLTDLSFVRDMVDEIFKQSPHLNSAVLNAGMVSSVLPATLVSSDFIVQMHSVNALSSIYLASLLSKRFVRSRTGSIVGISSMSVPLNLKGASVYSASKAAFEAYLKTLAKEVAGFGIRCNILAPAFYASHATGKFSDEWKRTLLDLQDIHEAAELSDITNVIDFLIGKNSRLVTGQTIRLGIVI